MYQGLYFNRIKGHPQCWNYYLRDDKSGIQSFSYFPTVYKLDPEGEFETLFGDRARAINGKYDKTDPEILEKDISKELVLLRDLYHETDDIPSYHNELYLDIEIEIIGPLNPTTIKEANAEITSIALIDDSTKEKICFILDKDQELEDITEGNKTVISCKTERDLIKKFLLKWEQIDPTIVIGYNSDFFDIPYLYYRIKKVLGNEVNRLSPVGIVEENPYKPESPITIALVASLDYMNLFKKYITKQEQSYKLGDIGLKYANLGKIEYNGSLDKLFKEDKQKFIEYNLRDCEILEALEEKQKFIELTITLCHICCCPYESIYYNTVLNEAAILKYLKRKNIVAPNKPTTTNPSIKELDPGDIIVNQRGTPTIEGRIHEIKDNYATIITNSNKFVSRNLQTIKKLEGYAGGYLLPPLVGFHEYLYDEDVVSMYPFIIISLNMGIETIIGRIQINDQYNCWWSLEELKELNPDELIKFDLFDKKTYTLNTKDIKISKLLKIIEERNLTISANGVLFKNDIKSSLSHVIEDGFNQRKVYKDLWKKAIKDKDKDKELLFDNYQKAYKILIVGMYGTNGINSYRFTDGHKMIAGAITNTGQRTIQESIRYINEEIKQEINS